MVLTDANGSQKPDTLIWGIALWEERLCRINGEGERNDGLGTRPHNHTFHPEPNERHEWAQGDHDVRIVCAGLLNHATQLSVAVGTF